MVVGEGTFAWAGLELGYRFFHGEMGVQWLCV